jgi:hypothetical protein
MKKKILLVFAVLISAYFLNTHVSENEKYRILNEVLKDNNLRYSEVCSKTVSVDFFENNTVDFNLFDKISVITQKAIQGLYKIKKDKITFYYPNDKNPNFSKIIDNCENHNGIIEKISFPIISSDKNIVLIKFEEDCNCMLGGQSGTYVFKKTNGKWVRINSFGGWIS